jgi:hypothetical protein
MDKRYFGWVVAMALSLGLLGCHKDSDSGSSGSAAGGGGAAASGVEREAQNAAIAELNKHWVKGPDGWTTAKMTGTAFAALRYIRQIRELTVEKVDAAEVTSSDRLNGFEWVGEVSFKRAPCREAGDQGIVLDGVADITVNRPHGQWSQWIDFTPEVMRVQKVKGQWQIQQDTWLLRGTLPTPQDYANAGVK